MGLPIFLGTETEYGIAVAGQPELNPVLASSLVVSSYQRSPTGTVRWDHTDEQPLRDARDNEPTTGHEPPSEEDLGLANTVLTNGARFYVDHAHPEYSTPECSNPRDVVIWDKAGERILEVAAARASATLQDGHVTIHKNNTDGKGSAYGTHENYLVDRSVPFGLLIRQLIPFFVTRPIYVGAGRIGSEFPDEGIDFQLTQRADFFEVEVGLETTLKRPIINTRDEPHADPERHRRLHVINADATLCEVATFLKLGTSALVLAMIEDGQAPDPPELARPVEAFRATSHDLTATEPIQLRDGRRVRPLEIQWRYLQAVTSYVSQIEVPPVYHEVLRRWEEVLAIAEDDPRKLTGQVDWATKLELLEQYADRHGLDWQDDRMKMVDLQYHDVRTDRGLYNRLAARGRVERLVADEEITAAMDLPPEDTRAYFRGHCLRRFRDQIVAAGWDALIFDLGRDTLQRVPMMDPAKGTKAHVGALLESAESAAELLDALTR